MDVPEIKDDEGEALAHPRDPRCPVDIYRGAHQGAHGSGRQRARQGGLEGYKPSVALPPADAPLLVLSPIRVIRESLRERLKEARDYWLLVPVRSAQECLRAERRGRNTCSNTATRKGE